MAFDNGGAAPNYTPVEGRGLSSAGFGHGDPGWAVEGVAGRHDPRGPSDDTSQAGNLFRLLTPQEQRNLFANIAGSLGQASAEIQQRQLAHFDRADPAYGAGVRQALKARGANVD